LAKDFNEMETQALLFQQIKNSIPQNLSLVDEVSDLLNISSDSAYRRIRSGKSLSIDELQKLCSHFNISLDKLFNIKTNHILFSASDINHIHFSFEDYMAFVQASLSQFARSENLEMIYSAQDIPLFHHFRHPELAAFKVFFYLKAVLLFPEYVNKKFSFEDTLETTMKIGKKIIQTYERIPAKEIWNQETINSFLRQIEFSFDIGVFENPEDAFILCDRLDEEINHIKLQAERGYKYTEQDSSNNSNDNYQLYSSEVIVGDNTILVNMDKSQITYLTYNVLSLLSTSDVHFCQSTEKHLRNVISKSALISSVSERERIIFFNNMHQKIDKLRSRLKNSD
jgi:transcriptional regulator with XRE-family HTH domain